VKKFETFIVVSRVERNLISAHINHVRDVAGVESVGIGASYDGINA
jgi:microsomal dipeptidase-like Zn-dependent dipeptidase